jgi:acetoin utilization deacetylase AcuC-like enzyme
LTEMASRHCDGRLVSVLEGGYDLRALGSSAAAHVTALMQAN